MGGSSKARRRRRAKQQANTTTPPMPANITTASAPVTTDTATQPPEATSPPSNVSTVKIKSATPAEQSTEQPSEANAIAQPNSTSEPMDSSSTVSSTNPDTDEPPSTSKQSQTGDKRAIINHYCNTLTRQYKDNLTEEDAETALPSDYLRDEVKQLIHQQGASEALYTNIITFFEMIINDEDPPTASFPSEKHIPLTFKLLIITLPLLSDEHGSWSNACWLLLQLPSDQQPQLLNETFIAPTGTLTTTDYKLRLKTFCDTTRYYMISDAIKRLRLDSSDRPKQLIQNIWLFALNNEPISIRLFLYLLEIPNHHFTQTLMTTFNSLILDDKRFNKRVINSLLDARNHDQQRYDLRIVVRNLALYFTNSTLYKRLFTTIENQQQTITNQYLLRIIDPSCCAATWLPYPIPTLEDDIRDAQSSASLRRLAASCGLRASPSYNRHEPATDLFKITQTQTSNAASSSATAEASPSQGSAPKQTSNKMS